MVTKQIRNNGDRENQQQLFKKQIGEPTEAYICLDQNDEVSASNIFSQLRTNWFRFHQLPVEGDEEVAVAVAAEVMDVPVCVALVLVGSLLVLVVFFVVVDVVLVV